MSEAEDLTLQSGDDILGRLHGIFNDIEARESTIYVRVALWLAKCSQELDSPKLSRIKGPLVKGRVSGNRNSWNSFKGNDQKDTMVKSLLHHVAKIG